jgi:ubiquitin carboxyl-terminal hydrolase 4/11/15
MAEIVENAEPVNIEVPHAEIPNKEEQRSVIQKLLEESNRGGFLKGGDDYFVIGLRWFNSWKRYVDYPQDRYSSGMHQFHTSRDSSDSPTPGPIESKHLLEDDGEELRKNIHENHDFTILNKATWDKLFEWYGGGPVISRLCVASARWQNQASIELRKYRIQVIWSRQPKKIVEKKFYKSTTIKNFVIEMRKEMKFNVRNIRVWDFHNGRKLKICHNWDLALDESNIMDGQHVLIEESKKDKSWPSDKIYPSYSQHSSITHYPASPPGQTGLVNLGNTCFMNSALQCLAASVPLADFFLSKSYEADINRVNPLGTKGEMSKAYYDLMKEIWSRVGVSHPRDMKSCIQRFAPQFSGYQQHDSQELLAFLLDGLHEDLNRIKEKPYVEYQNGWGSEDAWNIGHKKRNDSIIVDLFQGQLKSRLRCPENGKTYDQYDPFMYLTVPLPVQTKRKIAVTLYRADDKATPVKYRVTVERDGFVRDLKVALGALAGIEPERLITVDVHICKFHREFVDKEPLDEVAENDHVAAHEILIVPKKVVVAVSETAAETKSEDSDDDNVDEASALKRIIVYQKINSAGKYIHKEFFSTPLVLSVPGNCTYRQLYRIIVTRLSAGETEMKKPGGVFHQTPSLRVRLDVEHVETAIEEGRITSENVEKHKDSPREESDLDSIKGCLRFDDDTAFELIPTDLRGDDRDPQPPMCNDDLPLNLKDRQTICCLWPKKHIDYYFNNNPEIEVKNDPDSWSNKESKKSTLSLDDCLRSYAEEEQLAATDTWYCGECKLHVQAFKKFSISRVPKILVVHLKRFSYRGQSNRERIDDLVNFPINDFDVSEFVEDKSANNVYDLFAISNHYGSLGGGHYTAFVRGRDDTTQWYRCDDSNVSRCDVSSICTEAAYVLFYVRKDVEWPAFIEKAVEEKKKEDDSDNDDADEYDDADDEYDDEDTAMDTITLEAPVAEVKPTGSDPEDDSSDNDLADVTARVSNLEIAS